ncbi:O-antigen ligase family protein [Algibacter sp. 2305UL17-15]|uniref:O-antigen ligase family protein n=1 Tax=Algibacter sp. 2305UL17-15 TaxID=3231268 RepID=UPI0034578CB1
MKHVKSGSYLIYQSMIFALFLISGAVKFIFSDIDFPLDITLLLSSLIFVDILYNMSTKSILIKKLSANQILFLLSYLAFYLLMAMSLFYTKSISYGNGKTFFFILNLISFCYPFFMKNFEHKVFFKIMVVPLILVSIWFLAKRYLSWYAPSPETRIFYKQFTGNYLLLCNAIAFCVLYYIYQKKYLFSLALFVLIIALGGRGPILFLILLVAYWKIHTMINIKVNVKIVKRIGYALLLLPPFLYFFWGYIANAFKVGLGRITSFLNYEQDASVLSRFYYFDFAVEKIFSSIQSFFFGHGIGSFGIMYNGIDKREFPHNIFLEAWFELGLVGFLLTIIIFVFPILVYHKKSLFIKLMCVYFLMHSLKSGSLDGMRFMSGVYGMLIFFDYGIFNEKK